MKIGLRLRDGREVVDHLAQVTVTNAHGEPVMAAYHGPAGAIVCGHVREDGWVQFLEDTGITERVDVAGRPGQMFARVVPVTGAVAVIPSISCVIYSDHGDPAIAAALTEADIDVAHAGDPYWPDFCKKNGIFIPRRVKVQDLN